MASRIPPHHYTIGGVKLAFPCKAYPTQLSMMSMIIRGIDKGQNCLLESPTGSGKSLALLCSCLAWQHNEYEKRKREEAAAERQDECEKGASNVVCVCNCAAQQVSNGLPPTTTSTSPQASTSNSPQASTSTSPPMTGMNTAMDPDKSNAETNEVKILSVTGHALTNKADTGGKTSAEEEDDFQPAKKRFRTPVPMPKKIKHRGVEYEEEMDNAADRSPNPHTQAHWKMELTNPTAANMINSCSCPCHLGKGKQYRDDKDKDKQTKRKMIPRIFFGTRTHKQIAQIIRELKKTAYAHTRMAILGSREHTCIHPKVSKGPNKNEGCKELKEGKRGKQCKYFTGTHKIKTQSQLEGYLRSYEIESAWDIEDLVQIGRSIKACPYYATRSLKDEASIIFCPYNYLVDPVIRGTLDISMKGQIIVLDEAHNIEDSAREAASFSVTEETLQDTINELDRLISLKWKEPHTGRLRLMCNHIRNWITEHSGNLRQTDYDRALKVFTGRDIDEMLTRMGIIPATLHEWMHHVNVVTEENKDDEDYIETIGVSLSSSSGMMLKGLLIVFGFLFKDNKRYLKDYKIAVIRTVERRRRRREEHNGNRWLSARERSNNEPSMNTTLNFWCLNPAVAFSDFGDEVRTIILTSGTLSPMNSFASELGTNFPIQLEANHVIHKSQVWVGTVALGPNGTSLNAAYKNAETFAFQDEIGRLLLHVCQVIPYGVLCFLPSYSMLSKLMDRWQTTGAWNSILEKKEIMMETRGGDKDEFDAQLREFYRLIKDCEESDRGSQAVTGGLFFAVCRGKVSEGMDFADNNARAVITIGIPFPSYKDTQVELKRQYNDQHSSSRGLLTGSEWYEIQAYRALNQALGRCIRHKMDWGALILVDERYNRNPKKYISGLSKWVRAKVNHHLYSRDAIESLSEFAQARMLKPCPEISDPSTSSPPDTPQVTTPLVNKDRSASGYTPVLATPSRPQAGSDIPQAVSNIPQAVSNIPQGGDSLDTPLGKGDEVNPRRVIASGNSHGEMATSREAKQFQSYVAQGKTGNMKDQMIIKDGKFVKASSVYPRNLMHAVPERNVDIASKPTPGHSNLTSGNSPESLYSPVVLPHQAATPQQATHDHSTAGGIGQHLPSHDSIATPKAKLDFEDEGTASISTESKISSGMQQNIAKKLQMFARKENSAVNKQEQSNKTSKASKFYQFVDLSSCNKSSTHAAENEQTERTDPSNHNEDGREEGRFVTTATSCTERLEHVRAEFNQTPPPLFDSAESEIITIPESPMKPMNNIDEESSDIANHHTSEGVSGTSRTKKRKLEEETEDLEFVKRDVDETDVICKLESKLGLEPKSSNINDKPCDSDVILECHTETAPAGGRTRRRRLSRRRKDEKSALTTECIEGNQDASKQDVKEEQSANAEDHMNVRRSARRRHGQDRGKRYLKPTKDDFLDTIGDTGATAKSDIVAKCVASCRPGLFCIHCGVDLSVELTGFGSVIENDLSSEFLKKQIKITSSTKSHSKRNHDSLCQCHSNKSGTTRSAGGQQKTWIVGRKELLKHCEPFAESTRAQKGLTMNAYWSEADECCYRAITCDSCPKGFTTLGYEVLATNNGDNLQAGQIWFPPQSVGYCTQATVSKMAAFQ